MPKKSYAHFTYLFFEKHLRCCYRLDKRNDNRHTKQLNKRINKYNERKVDELTLLAAVKNLKCFLSDPCFFSLK